MKEMVQKELLEVASLFFNDDYAKIVMNKLDSYERIKIYSVVCRFKYKELNSAEYRLLHDLYKKHKLYYNCYNEAIDGVSYSVFSFTADDKRDYLITLLKACGMNAITETVKKHMLNFRFKAYGKI